MRGTIPPFSEYAFMAWYLVKHRGNFAFTFYLVCSPLQSKTLSFTATAINTVILINTKVKSSDLKPTKCSIMKPLQKLKWGIPPPPTALFSTGQQSVGPTNFVLIRKYETIAGHLAYYWSGRGCIQKFPNWPPGVKTANQLSAPRCSSIAIL
jgi:hypothetical protein